MLNTNTNVEGTSTSSMNFQRIQADFIRDHVEWMGTTLDDTSLVVNVETKRVNRAYKGQSACTTGDTYTYAPSSSTTSPHQTDVFGASSSYYHLYNQLYIYNGLPGPLYRYSCLHCRGYGP